MFLLLFLSLPSNSQEKEDALTTYNSNFQPRTQIHFAISPNFYNQLQINNNGADWLQSKRSLGGSLSIGLYQKIKNNLGLNAGAEVNVLSYNLNYSFTSEVQNKRIMFNDHDLRHHEYLPYVSLYLGFSYQFSELLPKKNYHPVISIGLKQNTISTYDISVGSGVYIDQSEPDIRIFDSDIMNSNASQSNTNFLSYYVKFGLLQKNKKLNTLHLNLVVNYSDETIGKGKYSFSNLAEESKGTFELGANYIGFEFIYGLTFSKPE